MLLNGHRTSSPIHVLVARKGYRRTVSYLSSLIIVRTLMACNDMRSNSMRFLFFSDEGPVLERSFDANVNGLELITASTVPHT